MNGASPAPPHWQTGRFWILVLLLGGTLAVICHQGFLPHEVFWANDYAFGALSASAARLPGTFVGFWGNFWWLGGATPSSSPSISNLLQTILWPSLYLKIYAPFTMFFLGFGAWFFFRQLRFAPIVCVIAGLGAGLNMHFFSNACWGLGNWCVSTGMVFIALGIIVSSYISKLWIKAALTGLSVGMAVMEGFDVGAIYSVFIGVFVLFYFWITEPAKSTGAIKGLICDAVVVVFAVLISASTLYTLVGTQLKGTADVGSSPEAEQAHWDFTTQWSLPKIESLRVIIPGIFGYRMADYMTTTNMESQYWGRIGLDPRIDRLLSNDPKKRVAAAAFLGVPKQYQDILATTSEAEAGARNNLIDQIKGMVQRRHTGSGDYTGVLVCLLAVFAVAAATRREGNPFLGTERRVIWFWAVAAVFSLLASWGRFGFVFEWVYHIPYFSNIRNPVKFLHPLNVCLILLSGYGLEAIYRGYLQGETPRAGSLLAHLAQWWKNVTGFDKRWTIGCVIALVLCGVGFLIMSSSATDLAQYMEHNGISEDWAPRMAAFSVHEVGLFLLVLGVSIVVLAIIMSGAWAGRKMAWAWTFLAAIMILDLSRADIPWIRYYNYKEKYSMNPVVDFLRQKPWEHRVVSRLSPIGGYDMGTDANFGRLCHWWLENDYPYNDIQSLELDQAPRMPVMDSRFLGNFNARSAADLSPAALQWLSGHNQNDPMAPWVIRCGPSSRLWRLTNTRYIFASSAMIDVLNQFVDPPNSFRTVMRLDIVPKPGIVQPEDPGDVTVKTNEDGAVALLEFTQALPRVKLYSNWKMMDDDATLDTLASASFDPVHTVLIATNTPVVQSPNAAAPNAGTADITEYASRDIVMTANALTPAVLLFNERTGDFWNVRVDGKPAEILRCNYIMKGVYLPPGRHAVEFYFRPPLRMLYITCAAMIFGILLGGFVFYDNFKHRQPDPAAPR